MISFFFFPMRGMQIGIRKRINDKFNLPKFMWYCERFPFVQISLNQFNQLREWSMAFCQFDKFRQLLK